LLLLDEIISSSEEVFAWNNLKWITGRICYLILASVMGVSIKSSKPHLRPLSFTESVIKPERATMKRRC
jgi:hypothetical protein